MSDTPGGPWTAPAPEPVPPPAPVPEPPPAPAWVPDVLAAATAIIEAVDCSLRIVRQAVGAVPALGGLGASVSLIEKQLELARKALTPPAG